MPPHAPLLQDSNPPAPAARCVDLHLHTCFSDGSYAPAELVAAAQRAGLAAIAVTDHDTLTGIAAALDAGRAAGLEVIAGVEMTCRIDDIELHLLGYFIGDTWRCDALQRICEHATQIRDKRVDEFVAKLNELGIPLRREDVVACSDGGSFGRPHVAMALVRRNIVKTLDEAFERFLKRGRPAYVERYRMTIAEAIGHIKRAGGVAVLAHPGLNRIDSRIRELVDQGLDGLEVWHTRHSVSESARYLEMTRQLGLLATGGSDDHGPARGPALIGTVRVPYANLEALKARAARSAVSQ